MADAPWTISARDLRALCVDVLERVGVMSADAATAADALVQSNLRGVDTHGVRLLPAYVQRLQAGGVELCPEISVAADQGATAVIDGAYGLGQVVGKRAMSMAIAKASKSGIGMVVARNSSHVGALAYYALMAVEQGMIGIAMSNTLASMAPTGGAARTIGNNPMAWAVPFADGPPIVLDMATSIAAWGKIRTMGDLGQKIPIGWALDKHGNPTDDPAAAIDGGPALPIGGPKGYGLALMIDILSGVLSGGAFGLQVNALFTDPQDHELPSHAMIAIDVEHFMPADLFQQRLRALAKEIHGAARAPGVDEILLPGEPEHRQQQKRSKEGIPLDPVVKANLLALVTELGMTAFIELLSSPGSPA